MLPAIIITLLSFYIVDKITKDYEKIQQENKGTIRPPKFIFIVGVVCLISLAALMIWVLFSPGDSETKIWCIVVFGIFFALGVFLVLYARNYQILYRDGEIIYRNIFGVTRTFQCQDIEHVYSTKSGGIKIIFKNGRKLSFSREESCFYRELLEKEHLQCESKNG